MTSLGIMASYIFVAGICALTTVCYGSVAYGVIREAIGVLKGTEKLF